MNKEIFEIFENSINNDDKHKVHIGKSIIQSLNLKKVNCQVWRALEQIQNP